jgi:hypothetical protein
VNPGGGGNGDGGGGGNGGGTGGNSGSSNTVTGQAGVYNDLRGTNDTLLGVGEQDTLIGGGVGSTNTFYLGGINGSYYIGNGNADYANISNFDPDNDAIELAGTSANYEIAFANNVNSIYRLTPTGSDLIAKVTFAALLSLDAPCFSYLSS